MQMRFHPDEARRFALMLRTRADDLRRGNRAVAQRLNEMHMNNWRDAKYEQFEKRYDDLSVLLESFAKAAARYAELLELKARRSEAYLERRY